MRSERAVPRKKKEKKGCLALTEKSRSFETEKEKKEIIYISTVNFLQQICCNS
jgi:hypothetical protein